jgi:hypothetical protein
MSQVATLICTKAIAGSLEGFFLHRKRTLCQREWKLRALQGEKIGANYCLVIVEGTVANANLSGMNVESLMNLRKRVDERLLEFSGGDRKAAGENGEGNWRRQDFVVGDA